MWSEDIPLLDKFCEFFSFKSAWHWAEKATPLPDWCTFSETPTLSPLLNTVEMMGKGNLYLSLSSLPSTLSSAFMGGPSCRVRILLET